MRRWIPAILLLAATVGVWQLYCSLSEISALVVPPPGDVARALIDNRGLLWSNFLVTAGEIAGGMAIALMIAIILATAIHSVRALRDGLYPLLVASQAVPLAMLAPVLVIWLGFNLAPKLLVITLVCFFPIVVATLDGLASVEPDHKKLMHTLGATRRQTFLRVEAPTALPGMFSGLRIAATASMTAAVLAEEPGSESGLGHLIIQAQGQLQTATVCAAAVVLAVFAILLFVLVGRLQRRLLPWATQ